MKENKFNIELIKDLVSIILLTLIFSIVYNFILYGNINFIENAKSKSSQDLKSDFQEVTIEEAQDHFNEAIVIDARSEENFQSGHIPGAINIPVKNFDSYIDKIFELPQNKLIIIYCEGIHCNLSHQLAEKLQTFGFKNLWIMYEGIEGWLKRNLPMEK